jgi:hypothetical protein
MNNYFFGPFAQAKDAIEGKDWASAERHLASMQFEPLLEIKKVLEEAKEILEYERLKYSNISKQIELLESCQLDEAEQIIALIKEMKIEQRKNLSSKDSKYDLLPLHSNLILKLSEIDSSIDLWAFIVFQIKLLLHKKALS